MLKHSALRVCCVILLSLTTIGDANAQRDGLVGSWTIQVGEQPEIRRLLVKKEEGILKIYFSGKKEFLESKITDDGHLSFTTDSGAQIDLQVADLNTLTGTFRTANGRRTLKAEAIRVVDTSNNVLSIPDSVRAHVAPSQAEDIGPSLGSYKEYVGSAYDGTWVGSGNTLIGNCQVVNFKVFIQGPRITTSGFTEGIRFAGGAGSKAVGVIHDDQTVDLAIYPMSPNGRNSVAHGRITSDGSMILTDIGGSCNFKYSLSRS